jgi:hypothetical protein
MKYEFVFVLLLPSKGLEKPGLRARRPKELCTKKLCGHEVAALHKWSILVQPG